MLDVILVGRSLINFKNRIGPNTVPWGTLETTRPDAVRSDGKLQSQMLAIQ